MSNAIGRASVPRSPIATVYTPDLMSEATIGLFRSMSSIIPARPSAIPTQRRAEQITATPPVDCYPWCPPGCVPDVDDDEPTLPGLGHLHRREVAALAVASADVAGQSITITVDLEAFTGAAPERLDESPRVYLAVGPDRDTTEAMNLTPAEALQLGLELIRAYHLLTAAGAK